MTNLAAAGHSSDCGHVFGLFQAPTKLQHWRNVSGSIFVLGQRRELHHSQVAAQTPWRQVLQILLLGALKMLLRLLLHFP